MNEILSTAIGPALRGITYDGVAGAIVTCETVDGKLTQRTEHRQVDIGTVTNADVSAPFAPSEDLVRRLRSAAESLIKDGVDGAAVLARDEAGELHRFSLRMAREPAGARDTRQSSSPVAGRVSVVTGGAQGFGEGLVRALAASQSYVWIADLNAEGAQALARELNDSIGDEKVHAIAANVADEASVVGMIRTIVRKSGGIDLFVSNAGVLRAGSVMEQSLSDFNFVTAVNYTGFFICVKNVAPVMALQNRAASGDYFSDIIQINSKSGLEGSNRNGAYAGSKFGGIGLVESFALELVPDNIKVNAICPGNFFEGPLWSDPDRGLFVQYLRTGKVPGAKNIEDVKKFYESKVPMKRGCREADVVRALYYLVGQEYETGQALPVTGGQVMLH